MDGVTEKTADRVVSDTHEVTNQPPPLQDYSVYEVDVPLMEGVARGKADWAEETIRGLGAKAGSEEYIHIGYLANKHIPELRAHDRFGNRVDEIDFHPAYHEIMRLGMAEEVHALPWNHQRPGAHVARAAKHYILGQIEPGPGCPLTMTFAAAPGLRQQPDLAEEWMPRITSLEYDPRFIPAAEKRGCTMGMAMTEKQGGSDVRANTTQAEPIGAEGPGQEYLLTGHKWFVSGTMSDAFLTLAHTPNGFSCFLLPQFLPDGTRNVFRIQKIKDKLGNRSNATSEIELCGSWARMVGEECHGVRTIMEMVNHTRLDCLIGTASIMRGALTQALHYTSHREAFGAMLIRQPLMRNVLADMALDAEAATTLMARLAQIYDLAVEDPKWEALKRLLTAVAKYWVCKRAPNMVCEALECHGGDGYVEDGPMPRWYREAPVSSVWEGSGNVMCLDALKTMAHIPESLPMLLDEISRAKGGNKHFDVFLGALQAEMGCMEDLELRARGIMERLGLACQASLLLQHAPAFVSETFCAARLGEAGGVAYGTLPSDAPLQAIIDRAGQGIV